MIKRNLIIPFFIFCSSLSVVAQVTKQEAGLKREVTLYNPYKPSLPLVKKRSFLPDMTDTMKVRPDIHFDIMTKPFLPEYTVSPIKAATLDPDPLPKLYKSYINAGLGNYFTPLAEISITNERSKKGTIGFYGRHFSTNGNVELQNEKKAFAGLMDNDASLFGRKFFKKSFFESSADFSQKIRYAYGYDTSIIRYSPSKKDIRMPYTNVGVKASLTSLTLDSADFSYDFDVSYDFFRNAKNLYQHNFGITGIMAKSFRGFYVGSGVTYDYIRLPEELLSDPKYVVSVSPFMKKRTEQWNLKLGFQALLDRNMSTKTEFHLYPNIDFSFIVVPSYLSFFAELSGKLEKNEPLKIISENPFLVRDGSLFKLPNTNHVLIVSAGLKGNTGIGGNYLVSASYSFINDILLYSNIVFPDTLFTPERGNHFIALDDDGELFKFHCEMNGVINDKISYNSDLNLYKYTLSENNFAWNKPAWDAKIGVKYNLQDKIFAGLELAGTGKRKQYVTYFDLVRPPDTDVFEKPVNVNLNLSAEYRYSKILSFWTRLNNISNNRFYEWAYYPSQRFLFMLGFTYSL